MRRIDPTRGGIRHSMPRWKLVDNPTRPRWPREKNLLSVPIAGDRGVSASGTTGDGVRRRLLACPAMPRQVAAIRRRACDNRLAARLGSVERDDVSSSGYHRWLDQRRSGGSCSLAPAAAREVRRRWSDLASSPCAPDILSFGTRSARRRLHRVHGPGHLPDLEARVPSRRVQAGLAGADHAGPGYRWSPA